MNTAADSPPQESNGSATPWRVLATVFAVGLLLQVFSPLRLNTDAARYLEAAAHLADGEGYRVDDGAALHLPQGYSTIVAALDRIGVATAPVLVLLNCACLGLALWFAARKEAGSARRDWRMAALTLASIVAIKHIALPISEFVFMALSFAALAAMRRLLAATEGRGAALALGAAAFATAAAISVRTIGVALVPALGWVVLWKFVVPNARLRFPAIALVVALLAGIFVLTPARSYIGAFIYAFGYALTSEPRLLGDVAWGRGGELAVALLNLPYAQLPGLLRVLAVLAGFAAACAVGVCVKERIPREGLSPSMVYLGVYAAIIVVWPFADSRFWLPVLPLVVGVVGEGVDGRYGLNGGDGQPNWKIRAMGAVVVMWFAMGFAALVWTTRITFSGAAFPEAYARSGGAYLVADYRLAFSEKPDAEISRYGRLVRRFDHRWRGDGR